MYVTTAQWNVSVVGEPPPVGDGIVAVTGRGVGRGVGGDVMVNGFGVG